MKLTNFNCEIDADGIALLSWDMPERSMNVIDAATIEDLETVVAALKDDEALKGAVITSAKEAFSGGADLTMLERMLGDFGDEIGRDPQGAIAHFFEQSRRFSLVLRALETCGKPVAAAGLLFGERYSGVQWGGVMLLSGAIFALALVNLARSGRDRAPPVGTLGWALLTGVFVAAYTTYDAFGIRATPDPFTFLAWFFMIDGLVFPWIALWRYRRMLAPPEPGPLMLRGVTGGLVAFVSFGAVMLATRIDRVGQAAVLRETSVVFAALIGWAFLGERVGVQRAALAVLIALGAVVVEFG